MFDLLGIDLSMIHSAVRPTARVLAALPEVGSLNLEF